MTGDAARVDGKKVERLSALLAASRSRQLARSFRFLVRNLRPIVQRLLFGIAVFISPSLPRPLRKLPLPVGGL